MPASASRRRLSRLAAGFLVLVLVGAPAARAQVLSPNLLYTAVQPCRVFDTRFATNSTNGRLIHSVTQTFNIVGDTADPYFSGQGGQSGGCALPGFDGSQAQVQAVVLNLVAVNSAGAGDLLAWPTDQPQPNSSVLNYARSPALGGLNLANAIVLPVRQSSQGGDLSLKAQVSDTDVLADVVGFFSSSSPVRAPGFFNLSLGYQAGNPGVATGMRNDAFGYQALSFVTTGSFNMALGTSALLGDTTGSSNIAIGDGALASNMTGSDNIAIGPHSLKTLTTGSWNIKIGSFVSGDLDTESSNIVIGNDVQPGDNNTIRIGTTGTGPAQQSTAFIAGINGVTSSGGTGVFVNSAGQLGTATSSLRFKEDVTDMAEASDGLMRLRPVTFRYRPAYDDGSHLLQYGLIAEEVAEVYPDLVQYDAGGQPLAVRYHFVNAMLLNEAQKQHARSTEQAALLAAQAAQIAELQGTVQAAERRLDAQAAEIAAQRARIEALAARLGEPRPAAPPR